MCDRMVYLEGQVWIDAPAGRVLQRYDVNCGTISPMSKRSSRISILPADRKRSVICLVVRDATSFTQHEHIPPEHPTQSPPPNLPCRFTNWNVETLSYRNIHVSTGR